MSEPANQPTESAKPVVKRDGARKWIPRLANLLLWLLFCIMAGTGLLLAYRLPPGSRGGRGLSALGWSRHDWGDLHFWISLVFLALIVVHMILHWRWFWQIACRKRAWPLLVGILAGLVLLFGILCLPVERAQGSNQKDTHESGSESGGELRERIRHHGGRE